MAAITQRRLKELLTRSLKLRDPRFKLETFDNMISGSVISESFFGKDDLERISSIRDVVDAALGANARRLVGTILAYTPDEWDVPLDVLFDRPRKARAG